MNGTSIRNIRRNKSEMAVGVRCNRYGGHKRHPHYSFKNYREQIAAFFARLAKS